jgi:hypothetical protein
LKNIYKTYLSNEYEKISDTFFIMFFNTISLLKETVAIHLKEKNKKKIKQKYWISRRILPSSLSFQIKKKQVKLSYKGVL